MAKNRRAPAPTIIFETYGKLSKPALCCNVPLAPVLIQVLSSLTSSLQSSATRIAAHASNAAIRFVLCIQGEMSVCFDIRAKAIPGSAPATSGMSLWNAPLSVQRASRVPLSVSVYCFFGFPSSRLKFTCSKPVSPFSCPAFLSRSIRCSFGANFIFFLVCFVLGDELLFSDVPYHSSS